jgi:hypothetical protein
MTTWLTTEELSRRWKIAQNTLRKWRVADIGQNYVKMGDGKNSTVRYRLEDIESFEERNYTTLNKSQ